VFRRPADYSPGEDNIVRVEVRQLRKRLDEYFAAEGKDEPVVIVIPKGGYVPRFEPREAPPPVFLDPEPVPSPARRWRMPAGKRMLWVAGFCVITVFAAAGVYSWRGKPIPAERTAPAGSRTSARSPIWQMLFDGQQGTTIVCADSTLVMAQSITQRPISLEEYVEHDYSEKAPNLSADRKAMLRAIQGWQFTDVTDVRLVQGMSRLNAAFWDHVQVRSAKTVGLQDFKKGHVILLGSSHSNPWDLLFEPQLNFQFRFELGPQKHFAYIVNNAPQAGELPVYRAATPGESGDVYSTIALVPNLRHTGHVLMIAGTTAEATEAAGEFILNGETSAGLIRDLLARNKGQLPYFELLLKSNALAGVTENAQVVATRLLPGD
jgi:hypothetical protein